MREKIMLERIGEPAMLEQLAEECTELGKAALKLARIHRRCSVWRRVRVSS